MYGKVLPPSLNFGRSGDQMHQYFNCASILICGCWRTNCSKYTQFQCIIESALFGNYSPFWALGYWSPPTRHSPADAKLVAEGSESLKSSLEDSPKTKVGQQGQVIYFVFRRLGRTTTHLQLIDVGIHCCCITVSDPDPPRLTTRL